jgi:hypothetical protein
MTQKTVTINGTVYDAHTGMPVPRESSPIQSSHQPAASPTASSHTIHKAAQKSQTLNRRIVKKTPASHVQSAATQQKPAKSPSITKFAPHPAGIKPAPVQTADIAPIAHPIMNSSKFNTNVAQQQPAAPKPAQTIKQEALSDAIQRAPKHSAGAQQIKQPRRFGRFMSVGSAGIALLLLGGYFTYLNMPNLSVRVAAAQAGVDATYPEYRPDGYSLSGAIAYSEGEVDIKFASNSGPKNFTISQKKSGWDSSAVLNNHVKQAAGENYITYSEGGLTIYTYGSNAAWINNGVLYTIDGDAPLSSDQIRRIATSM